MLKEWPLCKIEWKLKRGSWRPKLLNYAKAVPDEEIQNASRSAFSVLREMGQKDAEDFTKQVEAALEPLVKIKVPVLPSSHLLHKTHADESVPLVATTNNCSQEHFFVVVMS